MKVNRSSVGFINLHMAHLRRAYFDNNKKGNRLIKCGLIPFITASRRLNCAINHVRCTLFTDSQPSPRRSLRTSFVRGVEAGQTEISLFFTINQERWRPTSNTLPLQHLFARCIFSRSSWARSVMEW